MKKFYSIIVCLLAAVFTLTACGIPASNEGALSQGGVLYLKVNPEIAVSYDKEGNVTAVRAENDDGAEIISDFKGFEGRPCKDIVAELVKIIGNKGYFVEEIEGEGKSITIELERGSYTPDEDFLDDVAEKIRDLANENAWNAPVEFDSDRETATETECTTKLPASLITPEKALEIAMADAKVNKSEIYDASVELEEDDGRVYYEIEFEAAGYEFEYEIAAKDGKILDREIEAEEDDD